MRTKNYTKVAKKKKRKNLKRRKNHPQKMMIKMGRNNGKTLV